MQGCGFAPGRARSQTMIGATWHPGGDYCAGKLLPPASPGRVTRDRGWALLGLILGLAALGRPARANVVLDWNVVMMAGIRIDTSAPTLSTRNLAILHLAIYDAMNSVVRSHQPYLVLEDAPAGTSVEAAATAAGYEVLNALYPSMRARADDVYNTWLATAPVGAATTQGLALGTAVAQRVLAARSSDGATTEVPYIPSDLPGEWRRTPPFFRPPLTPQWRYVDTFALADLEPFVPGPPPALDSPEYALDVNQVKALGGKQSAERTAEQSEIAVFWSDFSYTAMPSGHWHEIAASIVRTQGTGLMDTARLMAWLSIAQADSAIVCWEAKFRYNLWRPVTAIQRANEDGNAATEADPAWDHLLQAPPFPAYTSGHSTFSKASTEVLTAFYGTDAVSFTAASDSLPGVFRNFDSLAACADEIGMSRIYGGIHFMFDNVEGKRSGEKVARFVTGNFLLPNDQLPFARLEAIAGNTARLRVHGHAGAQVVLECSGNLIDWSPVSTNLVRSGGVVIPFDGAAEAHQFFRVRE